MKSKKIGEKSEKIEDIRRNLKKIEENRRSGEKSKKFGKNRRKSKKFVKNKFWYAFQFLVNESRDGEIWRNLEKFDKICSNLENFGDIERNYQDFGEWKMKDGGWRIENRRGKNVHNIERLPKNYLKLPETLSIRHF